MNRDRTRTPAAKARTVTVRTARRMRIARNAAALVGLLAWGDMTLTAPAFTALEA